jgi:phospholipid/cholesterol/gamma-HCH transport system substrate-binding protein
MTDHTTEVVVGAAVVAAAAGFIAYAVQFSNVEGPRSGDYFLTASFRSVEGVSVGTDVRLAGVKVGTVTGLDLNPQTFRADTTFSIDGDLQLPEDTAVVIASEGLLGGNFVELLPGGSPFNLEPCAEIVDTQSSVSLVQLLLRFVTGSEEG